MGLYDSFRKLRHSVYVAAVDRNANEGLLKGYGLEPGKTELRFIGIYHVIRKLEEFNYHINNLPDHLSSRGQWEKRLAFLSDAEAVKQALLPAGNVE